MHEFAKIKTNDEGKYEDFNFNDVQVFGRLMFVEFFGKMTYPKINIDDFIE